MLIVYCIVTVILTKEMVIGTDECTKYYFKSPFYPGDSCEDIYNNNPESQQWSGYYWITDGLSKVYCGMTYTVSSCVNIYINNPETGEKSGYYRINDTQWTYCNMTVSAIAAGFIPTCAGVSGGWRRIVSIDISAGDDCPSGWRKDTFDGISFCRKVADDSRTCSSANFSTNGTSYQRVCGKARGYQKGLVNGFWTYNNEFQSIDGYYVEGLSITYGIPRQHIWTFAVGRHDNRVAVFENCPCADGGGPAAPPFAGTNWYCESGGTDIRNSSGYYFNDPLWDGSGCITSNCCSNLLQPWFYAELNGATTSDIEARICGIDGFRSGNPLVDQLELYIQ